MHWLRSTRIALIFTTIVLFAIGTPAVFGHVTLKHDSPECCSHDGDHQDQETGSDEHECHCLVHGGTVILPEPASAPLPNHEESAPAFSYVLTSPEPVAFAIEYPPQR